MRKPTRVALSSLAGVCVLGLGVAGAVAAPPTAVRDGSELLPAELPLGPAGLAEQREQQELAPGVTLYRIVRGAVDPDDGYTATVGFVPSAAEAEALAARVRGAGLEPRIEPAAEPAPSGAPLGWSVRVGLFPTAAGAEALLPSLRAAGLSPRVDDTAHDGGLTDGPWRVTILEVDPREFDGTVRGELATGEVFGRETTSAIVGRVGALAAVNGGFFTIDGSRNVPGPWLEGTDGDPAGIAVTDGRLVSESVGDRPALMLTGDGDGAVRRLATELTLRAGRSVREVTGLNREPGLVLNCGGVGAATPTSAAAHDYTCGNAHELVAYTADFGAALPAGAGYQVRLDAHDRVVEAAPVRGGAEPQAGAVVVQATGDAAAWLAAHGTVGARLALTTRVVDGDTGRRVPLRPDASVVNGGPLLVEDGATALDPVRDGWSPATLGGTARTDFYWRWYVRRNPRTAAGVLPDGRLVFAVVDGRQVGRSVGLSITETAALMRSLGVEEALNLDGGGSSTVVTEDGVVNTPSDPVERPVGDAVVLIPGRG
jgi:hypothetical protein